MIQTESFRFKHALALSNRLTSILGPSCHLIYAAVAATELLCLVDNETYICKIDAWELFFRNTAKQCIAVEIHKKYGVTRIDFIEDMPEKDQISSNMIVYDNIEIQDTLLRHDAQVTRDDCWWSLSLFPVGGIKRPLWVTPFSLGDGEAYVDSETGQVWVMTYDGRGFTLLDFRIDSVCSFSPVGKMESLSKSTSLGFVDVSELLKKFPPSIQREIVVAIKSIQQDILKMYSS